MNHPTLGQLKERIAPVFRGGLCDDREELALYTNRATEILGNQRTYTQQEDRLRVRARGRCLVLPRGYDQAHSAAHGKGPIQIRGRHFDLLDSGAGLQGECFVDRSCRVALHDRGLTAHHQHPWPRRGGEALPLRLYMTTDRPEESEEEESIVGKRRRQLELVARVRGTGPDGGEIINATGGWEGEEIRIVESNAADPATPVLTEQWYGAVDGVVLPRTWGFKYLWGQDRTGAPWLLGRYHPQDTAPCFRRFHISGPCPEECALTLMALRSLYEVWRDDDILPIPSLEAYACCIQGIFRKETATTTEEKNLATSFMNDAVALLENHHARQKGKQQVGPINISRSRSPSTLFGRNPGRGAHAW